MLADLREALRRGLDPSPDPQPGPGDRLAAVLALVAGGSTDPEIVFTERSATLSRHAGEVSFPGGLQEPEDGSLLETALREAEEEIGLDRAVPDVLGSLPDVHTFVSGILVVPFVGMLDRLPVLAPSDGEIARVITVPVPELIAAEHEVTWRRPGGRSMAGWVYEAAGVTIWGATGRMLHDLLAIARGASDMHGDVSAEDAELRALLGAAHTIAVVGLSSKPDRPSYEIATYLQAHGYRIIPVNPNETEVLGERSFASLLEIPAEIGVDVVDVFRRPEHTPEIARQAVAIGANAFWLQEGIVNEEAATIAGEGGLDVIMGVCIKHVRERLLRKESV